MTTSYSTMQELRRPAGRLRVTVDGKDVTTFRETPVPDPDYTLIEPFAYGTAVLTFPQVDAAHEADVFGTGELWWVREGARVVISRIHDALPEEIDYKGRVDGINCEGLFLQLNVGGEFSGPSSLLQVPTQMVRSSRDVGRWASLAVAALGMSFDPWFGPATDIMLTQVGGTSHYAWAQYVCAMSQDENGLQRTLMPTTWGSSTWEFRQKDYTTKHYTALNDDTRAALHVSRDASEAPNVIYGTGVTPDGERITNAKWPHVFAGPAPAYPIAGGAAFGLGTTDADTVNNDGITLLYINLRELGYLPWEVANTGVFTATIAAAVNKLKARAGLAENGTMTVAAWKALFNSDVTGFTVNGGYIAPLAEDDRVREWNRAANGAILGRNPLYDPSVLRVERVIDFGAGVTKAVMIAYAQSVINRSANMKNWTGTLTLGDGVGIFAGEHDDDTGLTADDIVPNKSIRPGMNVWVPYFDGGTLFHISGVDIRGKSAVLTIDTQARDLVEVQAINERDVDSRRDVRREWFAQNQTRKPSSAMVAYDESFGIIPNSIRLQGGQWNVFPVIMGQHGQVNRVRMRVVNSKTEYAVAAFSKKVTPKWLDRHIGDPMVAAPESVWEKESLQDLFDDDVILYAVGDGKEPCGYAPRRKHNDDGDLTGAPVTGRHDDSQSWPFIFAAHTAVIVYMAARPRKDCTLKRGRIAWPQLDAAA